MRALLVTAGLLVLTGSAAAGLPSPHTLRKSTSGPIEALAQDGAAYAWLEAGGQKCNSVHVRRFDVETVFADASDGSMTCHWDLSDGQSQLALAYRAKTVLWTLHGSGPTPFDYVVAASIGGSERRLDRLVHASNGTGDWLGGVAGSGRTLAYSYVDVEYVDKLACLSGGSCAQTVAGGGIDVVSATADTPLPQAGPALALATAGGVIAYIPATTVAKDGAPAAGVGTPIEVVDGVTGDLVSEASPRGVPLAIALSHHVLAVLTQARRHDRISWFDPTDGTKLGSVAISRQAAPQLAASDQLVVYHVGRALYGVATGNGRTRLLAKAAPDAVGLSLGNGQLVWAENVGDAGRLRTLGVSS